MTDLVTATELGTYLNDRDINTTRAELMIRYATAECETVLSPLPTAAARIVMDVAARGYVTTRQARGGQMSAAGSLYQDSNGTQGGIWLTRDNRAGLERLGGDSGDGAFTIRPAYEPDRLDNVLPDDYWRPSSTGGVYVTDNGDGTVTISTP